jgi:16S rRNA (uracil1498-N3)-methyltransferase
MPRTHQSLRRLFVPNPLGEGSEIALDRESSLRLVGVLRMGAGDELVLFNGRDGAWLGRIAADGKRAATVRLGERIAPQPDAPDLWYGFAPLKAARLDYMVQKATEMGVASLQPVITRFTQVGRLKPERIRANVIEAAEQCEVLTVPRVEPEITLDRLIEAWAGAHGDRVLVFADEATAAASPVAALQRLEGRRVGLLIGPEGGFADAEREKLHAQCFVVPISLGPRILRADTAAVAALAVIQAIIGDWR